MSLNVLNMPRREDKIVESLDENNQTLYDWNPVTKSLIFYTMAVDIGEITEKNWQEFYERLYAWRNMVGPMFRDENGEPVEVTPEDVVNHIGLKTNVTNRTTLQYWAKLRMIIKEDARREIKAWQMQNEERIRSLITS